MSTFSSIVSGLFALQKGKSQQKEFKTQAAAELFEAGNERINAMRAKNDLTDDLHRTIAGQNVAFIAAGIDPSSSLAVTARKEAVKAGERAVGAAGHEGVLRDQRRRARARSLKRAGKMARLAGFVQAASDFSEAASS